MVLRGKWAQGIEPRNFTWILQGKLAVCERPGGYGGNHRKVRRQEEIIWLREQGFTMIVSLAVSPHNLHNYDEMGMPWRHRPFTRSDDQEAFLARLFPELRQLLLEGGKLVLHQDELGDRLSGLMAAYVLWNNLVPGGPQAISVVEQLLHRQLGPDARSLLALVPRLPAPGTTTVAVDQPDPLPAVDPDEVG
jgi:hypothetical protein